MDIWQLVRTAWSGIGVGVGRGGPAGKAPAHSSMSVPRQNLTVMPAVTGIAQRRL